MYLSNINKSIVYYLVLILFIITIIYIISNIKKEQDIEGFNINDVGKIVDDVKKIGNVANNVTKEVQGIGKEINKGVGQIENTATNITKQIDTKLDKFASTLERKILGQVRALIKTLETKLLGKIKDVFTQIGRVLNNAIVKPLLALFKGIGNIFIEIFNILKKIGFKIVSLPGCIIYYLINGIIDAIFGFLSWITPNFIEKPIVAIWNATIGALISWFLDWMGFIESSRKCYSFNINEEIGGMNKQLKNIETAFTKNFGNIKFKI
jgi:Skp family chaperone for outer membrane proteins